MPAPMEKLVFVVVAPVVYVLSSVSPRPKFTLSFAEPLTFGK